MKLTQHFFSVCIIGELALFFWYALHGPRGVMAIIALQQMNRRLVQTSTQLEQKVRALKNEIDDWQHYPFYKEKQARELLQMAGEHEQVYMI